MIGKRYRVRSWIGDESLSRLYDAQHATFNRRVLVKMLNGEGMPKAEVEAEVHEMEREAIAASLVEHPNVMEIIDFEASSLRDAFLVRPWITRSRLASYLRSTGRMPLEEAADFLSQVLSGLDAVHRVGLVHRDLGAHTIAIIDRAGCRPLPQICGLGRCIGEKVRPTTDLPTGIHYASPELLLGNELDARSDVFACGVLLFEMLTGRKPFEAPTAYEVQAAILGGAPPSAAKLRPELGHQWLEILDRALDKEPSRRYRDALAFLNALPVSTKAAKRGRMLSEELDQDSSNPSSSSSFTLVPESSAPLSRAGAHTSNFDRFIGQKIAGKYAIESLIGSGNMGAVYKGTHVDLRRPVAVKVLHDWNRKSNQFAERFKSEALAASHLDHPNITRVLDYGQATDGTLYLVMEYVGGVSLEAVIATEGSLAQSRAVKIGLQIASSLALAHDAGIVHRDIKPENILVATTRGPDGGIVDKVKVCDFGIAKRQNDPELTALGVIVGSPAYMAPEQVRGETVDARTDIYCFGVTLYEALTGRLPHEAESMDELFRKKLHEPATRPGALGITLDPLLEDVVLRALESKRQDRHPNARELQSELVEVLKTMRVGIEVDLSVSIYPDTEQL